MKMDIEDKWEGSFLTAYDTVKAGEKVFSSSYQNKWYFGYALVDFLIFSLTLNTVCHHKTL